MRHPHHRGRYSLRPKRKYSDDTVSLTMEFNIESDVQWPDDNKCAGPQGSYRPTGLSSPALVYSSMSLVE